jgi:hypothetical protein
VDLAGLAFIDASGVAALARGRKLAAPQRRVLRMLTLTCMADVPPVHASVDEAAGHAPRVAAPAAGHPAPATATAT